MNNERPSEETNLEELANIPLAELVEPEWLEMPEIEPEDLELPYDYIQDLVDRGIIAEDAITIDIENRFLENIEREQNPIQQNTPVRHDEQDFGR